MCIWTFEGAQRRVAALLEDFGTPAKRESVVGYVSVSAGRLPGHGSKRYQDWIVLGLQARRSPLGDQRSELRCTRG